MAEFEEKLNSILGDQAAMGQIMALAQSLSGSGGQSPAPTPTQIRQDAAPLGEENPLSLLGELDPRMVQLGMRLFQEYQSGDDRNAALLQALRPFIRPERYEKLDRAVQVARISRVIRALFELLREGREEGRV